MLMEQTGIALLKGLVANAGSGNKKVDGVHPDAGPLLAGQHKGWALGVGPSQPVEITLQQFFLL